MATPTRRRDEQITHSAKILRYPCGITDIIASTRPIFREPGYEEAYAWATARRLGAGSPEGSGPDPEEGKPKPEADPEESRARSMRRAKARVRRLALANDFTYFVTLTLDQTKIDRYDPAAIVKKLNQWCSNQVKRRGLKYVLVPERHKDGALHFHGFFNGALEAVDSGHRDRAGHTVYNLPAWSLGFSTAIMVYGSYPSAVSYVCKYIGKQGEKPAGRWYYSGGDLREPETLYAELDPREIEQEYENAFVFHVPGQILAVVNGIPDENADISAFEEMEVDL